MSKEVRLIDANVLIEALRTEEKECEEVMTSPSFWSVFKIINEQPTAYDVEVVISKMEKEKEKSFYDSNSIIGEKNVWTKAIEYVRNGGKE